MHRSLAGKLLVASPRFDDFFSRSVVIVVEHNEEGLGLCLNRPSETRLEETILEVADWLGGEHLIHIGGPVSPNALTCIGEFEDAGESEKLIAEAVGMG